MSNNLKEDYKDGEILYAEDINNITKKINLGLIWEDIEQEE